MKKWANSQAFTIVELLIVVVVIAILAAITIVAYNGIQQRAYNSALIAAAKQAQSTLLQYVSEKGTYPLTTSDTELCLTADNSCVSNLEVTVSTDNTALASALQPYGGLVRSAPDTNARKGIVYYRYPTQTFIDTVDTAYIFYVLKGENQNCGLSPVSIDARTPPWTTNSSTGYSWTGGGGYTGCYIYLPH